LITEEYNDSLLSNCDKFFRLSKISQSNDLKAHEKSRITFFIFIEEVIQHIIFNNRQENAQQKQINTDQDDI